MANSKHFLTCFICGTFEIENKKLAAFSVTFDRFSEWKDKVKGIKIGSKLCAIHFDSEDIIRGKYIFNQFYPLKVYRLTNDAIPKHFLSIKSRDKQTGKFLMEKNFSSTEIAYLQSNKKSQPLLSKNVIAYKSKYSKTNHQSSTVSPAASPCGEDQINEASIVPCSHLKESVSQVDNEASPEQLLAILEDHNYRKRESTLSELVSDKERDDRFLGNDPLSLICAPVTTTEEHSNNYSLSANESLTPTIRKSNDPAEVVIGACLNNEIAVLQSSLMIDTVPQCTTTTRVKKKSCPNEKKIKLPPSLYTCSNCKSRVSCKCCKILVDKYEALLLKMGKLTRKVKIIQQREKRLKEREKVNMLINHELKSKIVKLKAGQLDAQIADLTDQQRVIIKTFITKRKAELNSKSEIAHGMIYDDGFLKQCIQLKQKSPMPKCL